MSDTVGELKTRAPGFAIRRFVLFVALAAVALICGLHPVASAHGPELMVGGPPAQSADQQLFASAAVDQSSSHQHDEAGTEGSGAPHPDHDAPVCHDAGSHDESTLTARGDRPVLPDVVAGAGIDVRVVAAPRAPPWMVGAVETAPARPEGGRHHLTLAQISRT
ncbi:hypothetical protein [Pseudonocardia parietis]|uniref:Uncharacterized protein n=1 Tax=Pseudonocardia parietis TaxID=570936 RepID=A0ABS4W750_9PSEU|nr:hypothetical protein [Pseudonocardia parietis]MBP2371995.1 hypothetical protein [Pseudonocardia parietis]